MILIIYTSYIELVNKKGKDILSIYYDRIVEDNKIIRVYMKNICVSTIYTYRISDVIDRRSGL